jgi:hypothetical protein
MIQWIPAVTNRSQLDVDLLIDLFTRGWDAMTVSERTEWLQGMKGAFNQADIVRIENNIQLLSDVLELDLTTFYGSAPDPNEIYFFFFFTNVSTIRSSYSTHASTPTVPSSPINTFDKVNAIEQILSDVYGILLNNFHYYAGSEIYAGNSIGLLL